MKQCTKCKEWKDESEFYDLRKSWCKECTREYQSRYRSENPDRVKESKRKWDNSHREVKRRNSERWRKNNTEKCRKSTQASYYKNRQYYLSKQKERRQANIEYYREQARASSRRNRNQRCKYLHDKIIANPSFRMLCNLRRRTNHAIKNKSGKKAKKTMELIGCSVQFLIWHIESLFDSSMSWDNYGTYWHIDHIVPCSSFDLTSEEHQKICFHWTNLRPLEARANIIKSNHLQ
jgi:hypothetical protein